MITIQSSSDNISIDKNQFVLKSGQTQVARISRRESDASTPTSNPLLPSPRLRGEGPGVRGEAFESSISSSPKVSEPPTDEQVYNGKNFYQWFQVFRTDLHVGKQAEAFDALARLVTPKNENEFDSTLLDKFRQSPSWVSRNTSYANELMQRPSRNLAELLDICANHFEECSDSIVAIFESAIENDGPAFDRFWSLLEDKFRSRIDPITAEGHSLSRSMELNLYQHQLFQQMGKAQERSFTPSLIPDKLRTTYLRLDKVFLTPEHQLSKHRLSLYLTDQRSPLSQREAAFAHAIDNLNHMSEQVRSLFLLTRLVEDKAFQTEELTEMLNQFLIYGTKYGQMVGYTFDTPYPPLPDAEVSLGSGFSWVPGKSAAVPVPIALKVISLLPKERYPIEGLRAIADSTSAYATEYETVLRNRIGDGLKELAFTWPDIRIERNVVTAFEFLDDNEEKEATQATAYAIHRWANELLGTPRPSPFDQHPSSTTEPATSPNSLLPSPRLRGEGPGVRGETSAMQTTPDQNKPKEPPITSPLYKGKTYEEWLAQLRLEADPSAWEETFHSIHHLATQEQKKELAEEVLALALKHSKLSDTEVCSSLADWTSHEELAKRLIQIWQDKPSNEQIELFGQWSTPIKTLTIPFESWDPIWASLEKSLLDPDLDPETKTPFYTRFLSLPNDRVLSSNAYAPEAARLRSGSLTPTYRYVPSIQKLDNCLHIMDAFPRLGQRYILYPVCDAIETGRRDRTPVGETIRAWEDANSSRILALKLAALSDSSEDLVNRVLLLNYFTNDELKSPETRTVFADSVNAMLTAASQDQGLLFGSLQIAGRPSTGRSTTAWEAAIISGSGRKPTSMSQLLSKKMYAILLLSTERLPTSGRPKSGLEAVINASKETHDQLRTYLLEQLEVQDLSRASFTRANNTTTVSVNSRRFKLPADKEDALEVYFCHRWANELRGTPTIDTPNESREKPLATNNFPASMDIDPRWLKFSENQIKKMDKDNNSIISREEWPASSGDFDVVDTNDDDKISVEEFYWSRKK